MRLMKQRVGRAVVHAAGMKQRVGRAVVHAAGMKQRVGRAVVHAAGMKQRVGRAVVHAAGSRRPLDAFNPIVARAEGDTLTAKAWALGLVVSSAWSPLSRCVLLLPVCAGVDHGRRPDAERGG
jgi:hypothetical protein